MDDENLNQENDAQEVHSQQLLKVLSNEPDSIELLITNTLAAKDSDNPKNSFTVCFYELNEKQHKWREGGSKKKKERIKLVQEKAI